MVLGCSPTNITLYPPTPPPDPTPRTDAPYCLYCTHCGCTGGGRTELVSEHIIDNVKLEV